MELPDLPQEVIDMISSSLSSRDVLACMGVSKSWRMKFNSLYIWKRINKKNPDTHFKNNVKEGTIRMFTHESVYVDIGPPCTIAQTYIKHNESVLNMHTSNFLLEVRCLQTWNPFIVNIGASNFQTNGLILISDWLDYRRILVHRVRDFENLNSLRSKRLRFKYMGIFKNFMILATKSEAYIYKIVYGDPISLNIHYSVSHLRSEIYKKSKIVYMCDEYLIACCYSIEDHSSFLEVYSIKKRKYVRAFNTDGKIIGIRNSFLYIHNYDRHWDGEPHKYNRVACWNLKNKFRHFLTKINNECSFDLVRISDDGKFVFCVSEHIATEESYFYKIYILDGGSGEILKIHTLRHKSLWWKQDREAEDRIRGLLITSQGPSQDETYIGCIGFNLDTSRIFKLGKLAFNFLDWDFFHSLLFLVNVERLMVFNIKKEKLLYTIPLVFTVPVYDTTRKIMHVDFYRIIIRTETLLIVYRFM